MSIGGVGAGSNIPQNVGQTDVGSAVQTIIQYLLQSKRLISGVSDDALKHIVSDLTNNITNIIKNGKERYLNTQKDYVNTVVHALADKNTKAADDANGTYVDFLKQIIGTPDNQGPSTVTGQVNQAIYDTLQHYITNPPLSPNETTIGDLRGMLLKACDEADPTTHAADVLGLNIKAATTAWPGENGPVIPSITPSKGGSGTQPVPPPTPVNPVTPVGPGIPTNPKTNVPFTIHVPEGQNLSDVYIRVQGTDPSGHPCFVTWDAQGNPQYHEDMTSPEKYCIKLSDLPHEGNTVTINVPQMISGRMFFSHEALHTLNPDPQNPTDPDHDSHFSMLEYTNDGNNIYADSSAVDTFSSPAIQMQMRTDQGVGPQIGYGGDPQEFMRLVERYLGEYDTSMNSVWGGGDLFTRGGNDELLRLMSPKHFPETFREHFSQYLKDNFLSYYQEGKGGHSLYTQASINGKLETLRGQVSEDGKTFNFYDRENNLVTSLPTNGDNSIAWLTGATGDWMGPNVASSDTQKDLMRDLSAMFNAGIRPEDAQTSWDSPISKQFFQDHRDLFYQATNEDGEPMYNVYDRAMHDAGFHGYAYDYDDMLGQDGTQQAGIGQHPSFDVTVRL